MSKLPTMAEQWDSYQTDVVKDTQLTEAQRYDLKKAFYAGAMVVAGTIRRMNDPAYDKSAVVACLVAQNDDLQEFLDKVHEEYKRRN